MVYEYKSNVIIMLCNIKEGGSVKCQNYWEARPDKFHIIIQKIEKFDMFVIRTIQLINVPNREARIVYQIHFTGWPDHGVPDTSGGKVFQIFCVINNLVDRLNTEQKPIIVHCSAGVGRTGTYVSMYLLEKEIMKQIELKREIIRINVFNLVRKIKEMRIYMVQTPLQYKFVYLFVRYLLETHNN